MGAPSSSGKTRPGSQYEDQGKPFKGQTKHLTESSGTIRSTPIDPSIEKGRTSNPIAGDLKSTWMMGKK